MSDSSRDPKTSKPEAEKKQPETVVLTAEELKAISGGVLTNPGQPPVSSKIVANPIQGTGQ